jgi:ComF family protein
MQRWLVDIVVPVPLALERLSERGYNQASLLARPLAMRLHLPYNPGALSRLRETRTQIGLTAGERRANVFGAFVARSPLVQGKNILVIDDVTTTGSTMDACAFALLDAGAGQVYCLTLAQASQHTENQPY